MFAIADVGNEDNAILQKYKLSGLMRNDAQGLKGVLRSNRSTVNYSGGEFLQACLHNISATTHVAAYLYHGCTKYSRSSCF